MTGVELLRNRFGEDRLLEQVRLAPYTTFHVGGPADYFLEVWNSAELADGVILARQSGLPITLLGGGSNVLISDEGLRGLVVRTNGGAISGDRSGLVRADAGALLNNVVRWTIGHGYRGLEGWAGMPGTVGGAVWGNSHFGGRSIGEIIEVIRLLDAEGGIVEVEGPALRFAYDHSRLKESGEIALSVVFRLTPGGDPQDLRLTARESLVHRKRTQPLGDASAGCFFQNLDPTRDSVPPGLPLSAGALIDRAGLKGASIGGARVSDIHANFIVSSATATAADIYALAKLCKQCVYEHCGVVLREEVRFLGVFER